MSDIRKFIYHGTDGQPREQQATDSIQVPNGVNALDAINKGQLDAISNALTDLINTEAARAQQAESALGDTITTEATARTAADAALSASLTSETNARTAADTALGGRIDTEISDRQAAVSAEESARIAADSSLRTDLDAEVANRQNAVTDLQDQIDALETANNTALTNAINSLTADLEAEEAARIAADSALDSALTAETTRATAAEAAEQAARIAADNTLTSNLASEASRATAAEAQLTSDLAAEIARAEAAELDLANDIAAEQSRAQSAESAIASDLAGEVTRATAAEAAIAADLAAEISRATATETANLQEAKDYADARLEGFSWKASVDYAYPRTGAYTLPAQAAALIAADGLSVGNRVLVYSADQGAHIDNGIYVVTGSGFARSADMSAGKDAAGAVVYVERSTEVGQAPGTEMVCSAEGSAIVGTDALAFVVKSRAENLNFGAGVQKIGFNVSAKVVATKPIYVNGDSLDFRTTGSELEIDGSGNLKLAGELVGGAYTSADAKHSHKAITETISSAATVGSFVKEDGSAATYDASEAYGCVDAKSGSDARVVIAGLSAIASGALNDFADGERVYLGSAAGVFCKYADVPSGKWAKCVGTRRSATAIRVHTEPGTLKA